MMRRHARAIGRGPGARANAARRYAKPLTATLRRLEERLSASDVAAPLALRLLSMMGRFAEMAFTGAPPAAVHQ